LQNGGVVIAQDLPAILRKTDKVKYRREREGFS
jgi:hypothetical protein